MNEIRTQFYGGRVTQPINIHFETENVLNVVKQIATAQLGYLIPLKIKMPIMQSLLCT